MANASGAVNGTEAFETLYRTKRVWGVIFRPPVREGLAKLRQRAVRAICKIAKVGCQVLRVVWRYEIYYTLIIINYNQISENYRCPKERDRQKIHQHCM